jgi:integrase
MSNDPWKRVEAFGGTRKARKVFLNPVQRKRLLENCAGAFKDLVEGALLTGARYGEMRSLLAGDYDSARRVLSIRVGKTGPRDVPVSDAASELFKRLRSRKLPTAPLFARDDGKAWEHSDQDELMREAAKKAKLPLGTVFYTLRHTHIANALTGGVGIHQVAKLCGTSVRMIELHYDKFLHSNVQENLNKIAFV